MTIKLEKIPANQVPPKRTAQNGIYSMIEKELKALQNGQALHFIVERAGQAAGIAWKFRKVAITTTRKDKTTGKIHVYMVKKQPV